MSEITAIPATRLRPFDWGLAKIRPELIRDKNGRVPLTVELAFNSDGERLLLVRWVAGELMIAFTDPEMKSELRLLEETHIKVILRDEFQTNGAFVVPEIWEGVPSKRDRSDVVEIPIRPKTDD